MTRESFPDEDETRGLVLRLVPSLKSFLHVGRSDDVRDMVEGDSAEESRAKRRRRRRNKKKPGAQQGTREEESEYEKTQKKMLLFLGRLDMGTLLTLLPSKEETGKKYE